MDGRSPAEEQPEEAAEQAVDNVAQRLWGGLSPEGVEPEWDAASVSPSSLTDTCGPSISSCSSSSSLSRPLPHPPPSSSSSSSCSGPALPPPWHPSVELCAVLTDTRLTLDVYQGGAAGLPHLWRSVPEQLSGVRYLRLGSEDEDSLNQALGVLHRLPHLRSLAIRGNDMFI